MAEGFHPTEPDFDEIAEAQDKEWEEQKTYQQYAVGGPLVPEDHRPLNADDPNSEHLAITKPNILEAKAKGKNDPEEGDDAEEDRDDIEDENAA